jgi:hypothetical protein
LHILIIFQTETEKRRKNGQLPSVEKKFTQKPKYMLIYQHCHDVAAVKI